MIRPISQQQLANISNPGANALAQLGNTFQGIGQQNQQNRLMKMQEEQQALERRIKTAPIAKQFVDQAMALPEEQRAEFFIQNRGAIEPLGIYDYSDMTVDDFKDDSLARVGQGLSQYLPKEKFGAPVKAVNEDGIVTYQQIGSAGTTRDTGLEAPAPSPLVNIGGEEKEEDKAFGKFLVKNFDGINERAVSAQENIQQLEIARNIDVSTGKLEPLKAWGASVIQGLGYDPDKFGLNQAANAEAFNGIMGNVLATKLAAQKGPQTDKDADRMMKTLASLGNTPEAKEFLINSAIALSKRQVEQRDFYANHKEKTGSFKHADKRWRAYINKTPLMGKNPNTGRPLFFNEFKEAIIQANDNITDKQILDMWRTKYRVR